TARERGWLCQQRTNRGPWFIPHWKFQDWRHIIAMTASSCLDDNHTLGIAIGPRWSIIPLARLFETARDRPVMSALRSQRVVHAKPSHGNCLDQILGIS